MGPDSAPEAPITLLSEYYRSVFGAIRAPTGLQSEPHLLPNPPSKPVRESKVTVKIPRPLYRKVQQVVEGSGFNSPTDFIVYVLRDLMGEAEESDEPREFSQEELDDVKRKLKNLGYL